MNKFISIKTENMELGKFYRVYTDADNATLLLPKEREDYLYNPNYQCWVSSDGNDTNTGDMKFPFKTIQKALDSGFSVINVNGGTYTQDLSIPSNFGLYGPIIQGYGTCEAPKTEIKGTITIGTGVSRVRFKHLNIHGIGTNPAVIDNNSEGRHVIDNCTVGGTTLGSDLIRVINGKNWWNVNGSAIEGLINLSGTGNNSSFNIFNSTNSFYCSAIVNTGYTFTAFHVGKLGPLTHLGGNIVCGYVGTWSNYLGKCINSTSINPLDYIGVAYSALTADGLNYGAISTTGATVLKNLNVESPYPTACLTAVSIVNTTIGTTATTLKAEVKKIELGISYNISNGELTFLKAGLYNINIDARIDCAEWDKKVEMWIEKWNGTSWVIATDSGLSRNFQNTQEVEINFSTRELISVGDKFRLRAQSDSATAIVMQTRTLDSTARQPALRLSISEVK